MKKATTKAGSKLPTVIANRMVSSDAKFVTVRALGHMHEEEHHDPGAEFVTTADRAAALGSLIEVLGEAKAEEASSEPAAQ